MFGHAEWLSLGCAPKFIEDAEEVGARLVMASAEAWIAFSPPAHAANKLVGTVIDITDRKRAEGERERLRRLEAADGKRAGEIIARIRALATNRLRRINKRGT